MSDVSPRRTTSHKRPFVTNKKLPPPQAFTFLHRDERETRETCEWLVMKRKGPWQWEKWEAKTSRPFSPCSLPLCAKLSERERRLGARQNQKPIYASVTKPLVLLSLLRALTLTPVTRMFYAYIRCTNTLHWFCLLSSNRKKNLIVSYLNPCSTYG